MSMPDNAGFKLFGTPVSPCTVVAWRLRGLAVRLAHKPCYVRLTRISDRGSDVASDEARSTGY